MAWLALLVATVCVGIARWVVHTVYPDVWAVAEQFGHTPTRWEDAARRSAGICLRVLVVVWWSVLLAAVLSLVAG